MVIGIIGATHGVRLVSKPPKKTIAININIENSPLRSCAANRLSRLVLPALALDCVMLGGPLLASFSGAAASGGAGRLALNTGMFNCTVYGNKQIFLVQPR